MKRTKFLLMILCLLIVSVGSQCNRQQKNQEVQIGAILPLTGSAASLGKWIQNGHELAVEEINQAEPKGIHINISYEDGMSDAKNSVSAFNKLRTTNDIKIFTTALSPVSLALKPLVKENNLILFATAAHPNITGDYKGIFRHNLTVEGEADVLFKHMSETTKPKKPRLIYLNDEYGASFNNYWSNKDQTSSNLPSVSFERKQDMRAIALKATQDSPDCLILVGYGSDLGTLLKILRETGYSGTILVNNSLPYPDVQQAAGDAVKGVYYVDYDINIDDPEYIKLNEKYKSRFGENIPPISLFEHNTIILISKVYKEAGGEPEKFIAYLLAQESFNLPGEKVNVTKNGDLIPNLKVKKFE